MDLRKLKTLIDLVSESNVSELEITEAEGKVRIVKASATAAPHYTTAQTALASAPAPIIPVAATPVADAATTLAADTGHVTKSPMVGTFYRAASPGAKSFVELGDTVAEGQTLCIIEAMKILNEIEADKAGKVRKILAENGQAVEYGQPLFFID